MLPIEKSMLCEFSSESPQKKPQKTTNLEPGQSILVLFCHSDGQRELFMVINKGVWVWVFF